MFKWWKKIDRSLFTLFLKIKKKKETIKSSLDNRENLLRRISINRVPGQIFRGRFFFPCLMLIDQIVIRSVTRIPRWPDPLSCAASITGIIFNCSLHTSNCSRRSRCLQLSTILLAIHYSIRFEHVTLHRGG